MEPAKQYLLDEIKELAEKALVHKQNETASILLCLGGAIASDTEHELMDYIAKFAENKLAVIRDKTRN